MAEELEKDLGELCDEARKLGATVAVAIDARDVIVDPRVRMKCQVPLCANYGVNLMCPPNCISVADFTAAKEQYSKAILVRFDLQYTPEQIEIIQNAGSLQELRKKGSLRATNMEGGKVLTRVLNGLEAACFKRGYTFSTAFGAGACRLCEECVTVQSGLPCLRPFEARPAMEAVGIDVFSTARRAGFTLSVSPTEGRSWVGLILVN